MSAIVLATLMLIFQIVGAMMNSKAAIPGLPPALHLVGNCLQVVGIVISLCFIAGGMFTVQNKSNGPEILSYTAVAAALDVIIAAGDQFVVINSAAYKSMLVTKLSATPQAAPMAHTIMTATLGVVVVCMIVQIAYSIGMYRCMSDSQSN